MKTKSVVLLIIAAAVGFAIGAVAGRGMRSTQPPPVPAPAAPAVVAEQAPAEDEAAGEALRRQIADLERSLAYRMEQVSELQHAVARRDEQLEQMSAPVPAAPAPDGTVETNRPPRRRGEFRPPFGRQRDDDPAAAEERQRRREDFQQRMTQLHNDRRAFLGAVDTTRMSAEQRENHTRLIEAIDKANEFRARMMSGDRASFTDEERHAAFNAMREVGELYQQERRFILEETGRAYGEDGAQFADYIENVIENTSVIPGMGRGFGRGPRGGGTPPPPPPPPPPRTEGQE
jgi:hypothetical protein